MKFIFYFIAILPLMWEIMNLTNINKTHNFAKGIKQLKGKEFDTFTTKQKAFVIFMLGYMVWLFIGFFTFQWVVFVAFFLFALIPKKWKWYRWIDSLISVIVLTFIVLNGIHFKIDILSYF